MIVICESASLASLLQPPSRANFKRTKKLFCIGGEKDSQESQTRNHPPCPFPQGIGRPSWFLTPQKIEARPARTAVIVKRVCFNCPVFPSGHGVRPVGPWANGRRQVVPDYVPAAPLAPGGVVGRLGAKGRGVRPAGWVGRGQPASRTRRARLRRWNNGTVGRGRFARRQAGDKEVLR